MPKKVSSANMLAKVGELAFIVVVIVAIVAGLATTRIVDQLPWVYAALIILGVIVSLTTIKEAEVSQFMMASVVLIVASIGIIYVLNAAHIPAIGTATATIGQTIGQTLNGVILNIMAFVAPAAIIPSLKAVYNLARKK